MLPIKQQFVKYNFTRGTNNVRYLVIHDVGNSSPTADAKAHFNFFNGGNRYSSAHYFVDANTILQVIKDSDSAWHCGDGGGVYGITNDNSIGIEICINNDIDSAIRHTVELTAFLMNKYGIPLDRVVRHYDASRKLCPKVLSNNNWEDWIVFKANVLSAIKGGAKLDNKEIKGLINKELDTIFGDYSIYEVKQGKVSLGIFSTKQSAITEALRWKDSVLINKGKVVWEFKKQYRVFQGKSALGVFDNLAHAQVEGMKWKDSFITLDGKTIWKFGK